MNRINTELLLKILDKENVLLHIDTLKDYAVFISTLEDKYKQLDFNTKYGIYMGGALDSQRREKHDAAIYALNELNTISEAVYGEKIYYGSFDDKYRNEIAQAIMILSENLLDISMEKRL